MAQMVPVDPASWRRFVTEEDEHGNRYETDAMQVPGGVIVRCNDLVSMNTSMVFVPNAALELDDKGDCHFVVRPEIHFVTAGDDDVCR